ncbi:MAG: hypothetical protein ABL999_14715 [Pyrinomonadaceae bacterium]
MKNEMDLEAKVSLGHVFVPSRLRRGNLFGLRNPTLRIGLFSDVPRGTTNTLHALIHADVC